MTPFVHEFAVDLRSGAAYERAKRPLSQGNAHADKLVVRVVDGGRELALSSVGVSAKVIRYDGQTVPLTGAVEDGAACVTLDAACYAVPGEIRVTMSLSFGEMVQTVLVLLMNVDTSETSVIVDNGVLGDLSELLSAVAEMRSVTAEAQATMDEVREEADRLLGGVVAAPAIICEASGQVAIIKDATARDAVSVVSTIEAVQDGTPDPVAGTVATITAPAAVSLYHGAAYDESADPVQTVTLPGGTYGGRLNWMTGELTITHQLLDATSVNWRAGATAGRFNFAKASTSVDACTHYPAVNRLQDGYWCIKSGSTVVFQTEYATLDEWRAYLTAQSAAGTPVQVLIHMSEANYRTAFLDPCTLAMLKGDNAVWSDHGSTDVSYAAETKDYIDDRVAAWERTGYTIAALGDSIMSGDGNGTVGIGEILADRIGGTCWEYAKGGATIAWDANDAASSSAETRRQNIQYQADLLIAEHAVAPDIILMNGGINDMGTNSIALGEISDGYDAELDNLTYVGGFETIVKKLKTAFPESVLIFVRVHRMRARDNAKQELYGDTAVQICDKWSVGVADVFHRSGMNTFLDSYLQYTYASESSPDGDTVHPNQEGYDRFYIPLVLAEVKRHIGEVGE